MRTAKDLQQQELLKRLDAYLDSKTPEELFAELERGVGGTSLQDAVQEDGSIIMHDPAWDDPKASNEPSAGS